MMTLTTVTSNAARDCSTAPHLGSATSAWTSGERPRTIESPEAGDLRAVGKGTYEDWEAVMKLLLDGTPNERQLAFLKLNRLLSGFLTALRAWDHREQWEDLRQEVLMKLVKSFARGQLRESKAFVTYAQTITRHEFYRLLRAQRSTDGVEVPEVAGEVPMDTAATLAVRTALQGLPAEHRRAVQAVYVEGMTYEEAAARTATPLGSLKRYLRLGVARLREQLEGALNAA